MRFVTRSRSSRVRNPSIRSGSRRSSSNCLRTAVTRAAPSASSARRCRVAPTGLEHTTTTELFYVLDGHLRVLAGDEVMTIGKGDLASVPSGMMHAFAAPATDTADMLIIVAPGIDKRFDYFRLLAARDRRRGPDRRRAGDAGAVRQLVRR